MASFFTLRDDDEEVFVPTEFAISSWGNIVRGPAVTGLLARAFRRAVPDQTLIPTRTTFDLHSPVPMQPLRTETRVLRAGRRLQLLEADLIADDRILARARSLWLRPNPDAQTEDNRPWEPDTEIPFLGDGPYEPTEEGRIFWSEGGEWTVDGRAVRDANRKAVWQIAVPTVEGEVPASFQIAATASDVSNLSAGWGPIGLDFINADATLSLSRLPVGDGVGVLALDRSEHDGIAIGTTMLFDRLGKFGSASVTTLFERRLQFKDRGRLEKFE